MSLNNEVRSGVKNIEKTGKEPEYLIAFRIQFEKALARFLEEHGSYAKTVGAQPGHVYDVLVDFSRRGGKRHRPFLFLQGYLGVGGDPGLYEQVILASVSIELMQSYLLIHDDIMDRSSTRRGFPTVHRVLQEELRSSVVDWGHVGESLAILAGQMAMSLGAMVLMEWPGGIELAYEAGQGQGRGQGSEAGERASVEGGSRESGRFKALRIYHEVALDECYGQIMDVLPPLPPLRHDSQSGESEWGGDYALLDYMVTAKQQIQNIMYYKTTRYTTEGPMHMGAALAGAGGAMLEQLSRIARPMGELFQLKDDILGLRGDPNSLGKPVGGDIREGKITIPIIEAIKQASPADNCSHSPWAMGSLMMKPSRGR